MGCGVDIGGNERAGTPVTGVDGSDTSCSLIRGWIEGLFALELAALDILLPGVGASVELNKVDGIWRDCIVDREASRVGILGG